MTFFLVAVKDNIPTKCLKGRNPVLWLSGAILDLIKKKSVRRKLGEKFRSLRARITRMLKKSREKLFETANINSKCNPERLWSVLKINSKTRNILELVSMETPSFRTFLCLFKKFNQFLRR